MKCPNCASAMQEQLVDGQHILHCGTCGSSFFEENGINRITEEAALKLSQEKTDDIISGQTKLCPRDQTPMFSIQQHEAVPQNVTLLSCPKCRGIFTYPDDLVNFKRAQNAKINYFKTWQMPLPSVRAVALFGLLLAVGFSIIAAGYNLNQRTNLNSQADEISKTFSVTADGRLVFLAFKTNVPLTSRITFYDDATGAVAAERAISTSASQNQSLIISSLDPAKQYSYEITLSDKNGTSVKLPKQKLQIK